APPGTGRVDVAIHYPGSRIRGTRTRRLPPEPAVPSRLTARPTANVATAPVATFQVQATPGWPKSVGERTPTARLRARPAAIPDRVPHVVAERVRMPSRKAPTVGPEA